jgi:tRNA A-37 threonylcarbamoyl transferase component Bud32
MLFKQLNDQLNLGKIYYQNFSETRSSYLFRLRASSLVDAHKELVVKIYKININDSGLNPSENEYHFLKTLNSLSSDIPQLVIPKAIMHIPEVNAVVMEFIHGNNLQGYMPLGERLSSASEKKRLEAYFKYLGNIIGLIHARTYKSNSEKPSTYMNARFNYLKNQVRYSHIGPFKKYVDKGLKCIEEGVSTLSKTGQGITWTHGDLCHSNVLFTPYENKIALIDFAESRFDSPYHDISRFSLRTLLHGSRPHKYSSRYLQKLNDEFIRGYINSFPYKISRDFFLLYSIFNLIQFISFLYKSEFSELKSLRNWYALYLLNNMCNHFYREFR